MEQETKEWLEIESLVSGLADIARKIKEMQKCSSSDDNCNTSDENCKTYYRGMLSDERCKKAESAIESNPEAAAAILPKGSDIQQEAIQAAGNGPAKEVNNNVVDEAIKYNIPWEDEGLDELSKVYNNVKLPKGNPDVDNSDNLEYYYNRLGQRVFDMLNNTTTDEYRDTLSSFQERPFEYSDTITPDTLKKFNLSDKDLNKLDDLDTALKAEDDSFGLNYDDTLNSYYESMLPRIIDKYNSLRNDYKPEKQSSIIDPTIWEPDYDYKNDDVDYSYSSDDYNRLGYNVFNALNSTNDKYSEPNDKNLRELRKAVPNIDEYGLSGDQIVKVSNVVARLAHNERKHRGNEYYKMIGSVLDRFDKLNHDYSYDYFTSDEKLKK